LVRPGVAVEIALAEVDRVMAAGMRFGCVLADADKTLHYPPAIQQGNHSIDGVFTQPVPEVERLKRPQKCPANQSDCATFSVENPLHHAGAYAEIPADLEDNELRNPLHLTAH